MFSLDKSITIVFGMLIGLISIYLGYKLFIKGIEGSSSFDGKMHKIKLSLRNASPGLFFALFGAFIVITGVYKKEIHSNTKYKDGKKISESYIEKGSDEIDLAQMFNIAVNLKSSGNIRDSKIIYESIIYIDSTYHLAQNNLAILYLEQGKYNKALSHAKKAVKYGKDSEYEANYYDTLAKVYLALDDKRNSSATIKKAIELNPVNTDFKKFLKEINSN